MSIFKAVLSNANSPNEELNHALICIWNLCFDEKVIDLYKASELPVTRFEHVRSFQICEIVKKDKELMSTITNIKITSPSEELQRRAAGILFTINDLLRKSNFSLDLLVLVKTSQLKLE